MGSLKRVLLAVGVYFGFRYACDVSGLSFNTFKVLVVAGGVLFVLPGWISEAPLFRYERADKHGWKFIGLAVWLVCLVKFILAVYAS